MAYKHSRVSEHATSQGDDDFTRIKGIGAGIQNRLNSYGIHTYAQLAALPPETIAALLKNLSAEQVIKKKWLSEAARLATSMSEPQPSVRTAPPADERQHYENFTFEFLLDRKNKFRRIQVVHVQSGDVDTWLKWDPERLIDFLARHAGSRLTYSKQVPPAAVKGLSPKAVVGINEMALVSPLSKPEASAPFTEIFDQSPKPYAPDAPAAPKIEPPHLRSQVASTMQMNQIELLAWKTVLENTDQPEHYLTHDQAFDVKLSLDLSHTSLPETSMLNFSAILYAKKLGDGLHQAIAETKKIVPLANTVELRIGHVILPQGLYRLDALLTLMDPNAPSRPCVNTSVQGGLVQVY